jgi:hypothetical protein
MSTLRTLPATVGDLVFELARAEDDDVLRRLLRDNPIPGWVRLSFEREPSYFAAATIEGDNDTVLARETAGGRVIGMFSRSVQEAYLDGRPRRLGYLGQLRIDQAARGRFGRLREGYAACRRLRRDDEAPFDLTSIVEANHRVRRVLTANLPGMPTYRELEPFATLVLPCHASRGRRSPRGLTVEQGDARRLGNVARHLQQTYARYQCAPRWTAEALASERCRGLTVDDFLLALSGGALVGCLALWDQSGFKQTVVHGYAPRLARVRPLLNAVAALAGYPRIPRPGQTLRSAYLSHIAVDDPDVLSLLIRHALSEAAHRGYECLILGLSCRNPLLEHVKRRFRCLTYRSILYLVHWQEGAHAARALDGRIAHVEVATL